MLRHVALTCVLGVALGCAVAPTARVVRAQVEIDAATLAGADQYAIYEITKAREYIHKAREQIGYSQFEMAQKFADLAVENGEKAKQVSREHPTEAALPAQTQPPPQSPPPSPTPVIIQQTTPSNPAGPLPTGNGQ